MPKGDQEQLRFHPVESCTGRADFDGGAMSSGVGAILLPGVDRHVGLGSYPLAWERGLASASTFSRLEDGVSKKYVDRLVQVFVGPFIASYAQAPEAIVLDLDDTVEPTKASRGSASTILMSARTASCRW